ncbi:hypothetical protein FOMPIDRAFT_82362 [Fomitopsis schrenkii]|uniref:Uncharacterized protein n=1 Tax=Fomitopsis schrenkii TaxID=2126942 RepID=S8EUV7_FOMSC|nr:hypothetical protein FOMPIDRAFT_82362 [Fomitopsis schrenkii]
MLILPFIWQSLATLVTVRLVTVGNGLSVFVDIHKPLHATIGHGSTWFIPTVGEVYGLSTHIPGTDTRSPYKAFYTPLPRRCFYLGDLALLQVEYSESKYDGQLVASYEWFPTDLDDLSYPDKVEDEAEDSQPDEPLSIPLINCVRLTSTRLLGFDPAPTPMHFYANIGFMLSSVFLLLLRRRYLANKRRRRFYLQGSSVYLVYHFRVGPYVVALFFIKHRYTRRSRGAHGPVSSRKTTIRRELMIRLSKVVTAPR